MDRKSNWSSSKYGDGYQGWSRRNDWNYREKHSDSRERFRDTSNKRKSRGHNPDRYRDYDKKESFRPKQYGSTEQDQEQKAEKQKTADLLKSKLSSLTAEDKSNSMKELLEKDGEDSEDEKDAGEKETRRIAHLPRPVAEVTLPPAPPLPVPPPVVVQPSPVLPLPLPPPLPFMLTQHLEDSQDDMCLKAVQNRIKRKVLQDLVKTPITELKGMVDRPRAQDNLFLSHLVKDTRALLSDKFRKFAEQKLQMGISDTPQMLLELENLVDADIAADVSRLPLETIQTLSDIFNLNLDGDLTPLSSASSVLPTQVTGPTNVSPLAAKLDDAFNLNTSINPQQVVKDIYDPFAPCVNSSPEAVVSIMTNATFLPDLAELQYSTANNNTTICVVPSAPIIFVKPTADLMPSPSSLSMPPQAFTQAPPEFPENIEDRSTELNSEADEKRNEDHQNQGIDVESVIFGIQKVVKQIEKAKKEQEKRLECRKGDSETDRKRSKHRKSIREITLKKRLGEDSQKSTPGSPALFESSLAKESASVTSTSSLSVSSKPLSLSDKLKVMTEISGKKNDGPKLMSVCTQTAHPLLLNRASQCRVELSSTSCQTLSKELVNNASQTCSWLETSRHISCQTVPCHDRAAMSTEHIQIQTESHLFASNQACQTQIYTEDKAIQHECSQSTRGEQVNRAHFSASKYAQTTFKSLAVTSSSKDRSSKSDKPFDRETNKDDVKIKNENDGTDSAVHSSKEVKWDDLLSEFKRFRDDIKAMGETSPLRFRIIKYLLPIMISAFENGYGLFCDVKPQVNNKIIKKHIDSKSNKRSRELAELTTNTVKIKASQSKDRSSSKNRSPSRDRRKPSISPSSPTKANPHFKKRHHLDSKYKIRSRSREASKSVKQSVSANESSKGRSRSKSEEHTKFTGNKILLSVESEAKIIECHSSIVKERRESLDKAKNKNEDVDKNEQPKPQPKRQRIESSSSDSLLDAIQNQNVGVVNTKKTTSVARKPGPASKRKVFYTDNISNDTYLGETSDINALTQSERPKIASEIGIAVSPNNKFKRLKLSVISDSSDDDDDSHFKGTVIPTKNEIGPQSKSREETSGSFMEVSSEDEIEPSTVASPKFVPTLLWYKKEYKLRKCSIVTERLPQCLFPKTPEAVVPPITFDFPQIINKEEAPSTACSPVHLREQSSTSDGFEGDYPKFEPLHALEKSEELQRTPGASDLKDADENSPVKSCSGSDDENMVDSLSGGGDGLPTGADSVIASTTITSLSDDHIVKRPVGAASVMLFQDHNSPVFDFKISGNHVLAGCKDSTVYCYTLKTGKRKRVYTPLSVVCFSVLPQKAGEVIFCGGSDQIVRAFSVQSSEMLKFSSLLGGVPECMYARGSVHQDGALYIGLDTGECVYLHPKTLKVIGRIQLDAALLCLTAVTVDDSSHCIVASTTDNQLTVKDFECEALRENLNWECSKPVRKLLFHDSNLFCIAQLQNIFYYSFDLDNGWSGPNIIAMEVNAMCLCKAQKYLFVGTDANSVAVIDMEKKTHLTEFDTEGGLFGIGVYKKRLVGCFDGGRLLSWPPPSSVRQLLEA